MVLAARSRRFLGVLFLGVVTITTVCSAPAARAQVRTGMLFPLNPVRILDTRNGTGGFSGAVVGGTFISVQVAGRGGVPAAGATAVALTLTAVAPAAAGHLTVWPSGSPQPLASVLNFPAGRNVPNFIQVKLGADGRLNVLASATVQIVIDIVGYYGPDGAGAAQYVSENPTRVIPQTTMLPRESLIISVDTSGVGAGQTMAARFINVTVTNPTAAGFVTVYSGELLEPPLASSLNFMPGSTVANNVITRLSINNEYVIYNGSDGSIDVIVDALGYFARGAGNAQGLFRPLDPVRLLDTRVGTGGILGPLGPGQTLSVRIANVGGVPPFAATDTVVTNLTVTGPSAAGYLTLWDGVPNQRPDTSNINFGPGQTVANHAAVTLFSSEFAQIFNFAGATHVVLDLYGYYTF